MNGAATASRAVAGSVGIALMLAAGGAQADDLRGADRFAVQKQQVAQQPAAQASQQPMDNFQKTLSVCLESKKYLDRF